MPSPSECITNEIKRRLSKTDPRTVTRVCEIISDRYARSDFKRVTDLIEEGVKLAKKMD